jgi:hypothetical protein
MVVEIFGAYTAVAAIASVAVLWSYSALPKIDWKLITAGALLYLTSAALGGLTAYAGPIIGTVQGVVNAIAAILVVVGALQNLASQIK